MYETNTDRHPTFYPLHGTGSSDHSWNSVRRAGFIPDKLIAAGRDWPIVVVMPTGHTRWNFGGGTLSGANRHNHLSAFAPKLFR